MRTRDARIAALRKVPLLAALSKRDLARILDLGKEKEFPKGATITKLGNTGRDFYLILEGDARVTVPGRRTATLGPGDFFGEMSVLDGGPRSATIVALTRLFALRIDRGDFLKMLDEYGSIGRKILVEMSKRVRRAERATATH
jgi:CRP/FNR family cyclic AMP-dependent transcriptional regulator